MAFARFSPWKSRAALRPPPPPLPFPDDGGRLPSFGTKLFILAQASISVPSHEKCSLDNSERTCGRFSTVVMNLRAGPDDRIVSSKFTKGTFNLHASCSSIATYPASILSRTFFPESLSIRQCWPRELFVSRFRYYYVLRLLPVHHFPLRFRL